jgi:hypothetical protein
MLEELTYRLIAVPRLTMWERKCVMVPWTTDYH